jgi:GNAT superfamily N-acetyltransferase
MALRTDPVSLSLISHAQDAYWIAELGVVPQYQGKGIGSFLLDYLVFQKRNAGITEFLLCTAAKNNDATHLYEARGFKVVLSTDGIPVTIPISQMRTDGVVRTDNRVFFHVKASDYVYGRTFSERGR